MNRGWFPLHRKIFESDVWAHPTARIVWIYILGTVAYKPVKLSARYQCVTLEPAQMLTSRAVIAAKCRLSERETRTAIKYLISTNRVTIKATKRFTIITVVNWPLYRDAQIGSDQQNDQQNAHQVTNRRPTGDHIQELKTDNKDLADGATKNVAPMKPKPIYYDTAGRPMREFV